MGSDFYYCKEQTIKDSKRDLTIMDMEWRFIPKNNRNIEKQKWYRYRCNICNWNNGWMYESNLKQGRGCPVCNNQIVVEHINSIVQTDNWMCKYFQGGYNEAKKYVAKSGKKIYPRCPDCGRVKDKPIVIRDIYKLRSMGCICSKSRNYPNKFMFAVLTQIKQDFEPEFSPEWIYPKKYDFYFEIDDKKYILEMDGGWHQKDNDMSGQTKEECRIIDDYKDLRAFDNNIQVIRINCNYEHRNRLEFIKNSIIKSEIKQYFNLDKVNWLECDKFALTPRVEEACAYWNTGKYNIIEIASTMKINVSTVSNYLKNGDRLALCIYKANGKSKFDCRTVRIDISQYDEAVRLLKENNVFIATD